MSVLSLEIQFSREEGWDSIKRFNPTTGLCPSQARIWISFVICRGVSLLCSMMANGDCSIFDIRGSVDHQYLNFLLKNKRGG